LNFGETGPVLTCGGVVFWALELGADAGGLRSALVALPLAAGAAGATAPVSLPSRSPSAGGALDVPRVRMKANTATIAAEATIAAPMALCERCAFRGRAAGAFRAGVP
jgi:hypothetical protein